MSKTEMKFDNYFMYSIDGTVPMGEKAIEVPPCGPMAEENSCPKRAMSKDTCCTHVQMDDHMTGMTHSFYRCMNQKIVDASFSVQIDGMMMSMACTGDQMSAASYFSAATLLASIGTLITISTF